MALLTRNSVRLTLLCIFSTFILIEICLSVYHLDVNQIMWSVLKKKVLNINSAENKLFRATDKYQSIHDIFARYESKYEIRQLLREIESNVKFTNSTSSNWNSLYSTGHSPHYYNGGYDLRKTSKHIRFPYICRDGSVIDIISNWTFKINETALSSNAKRLLSELQNRGFYGNLYAFHMHNLQRNRSPFKQPMNILWIGNSHIKQIYQSTFGIIDTLNNSDEIVQKYVPNLTPLDKNKWQASNTTYSYSELRCDDWGLNSANDWPGANIYHFDVMYMRHILDADRVKHNIKMCDSCAVHANFGDNSNSTYFFFNDMQNKTMQRIIHQRSQLFRSSLVSDSVRDVMSSNILVFNHGNDPIYDLKTNLEADLQALNIRNKSVIFMGEWEENLDRKYMNEIQSKYHNIIMIDWLSRFQTLGMELKMKLRGSTNHFCMPGLPAHAMLSVTNLIHLLHLVDAS